MDKEYKQAELTHEEIQHIRQMEEALGYTLIAYENPDRTE